MNIAEKIYDEVRKLPVDVARQVLDFIGYLEKKHNIQGEDLKNLKDAQTITMSHVWDNEADEVWNEDSTF